MKNSHLFISKHGLWSKLIMAVLIFIIVRYALWGLESDKTGSDIAMVLGAVFTPMIGLFKFVLEYADRKNDSHEQ